MNHWSKLSIEYANQRSYLDDLFQIYPTIPEGIRNINNEIWDDVEKAFNRKNNNTFMGLLDNLWVKSERIHHGVTQRHRAEVV